jgi:hypothetical protein
MAINFVPTNVKRNMPFAASGEERKGRSGIFRRPKDWDKKATKMSNVFKNAILPLKGGKMIKASIVYVALEVAVSKLLRRITKAQNKSIGELAATHLVSLGFMGGISASMTQNKEKIIAYGDKSVKQHIKQGMKGLPALFVAQFVFYTFWHGFYMGGASLREMMITAAAKILTRPIASKIYPKGKFFQNAFDCQQLMEEAQMMGSNFGRIPQGDLFVKESNKP